VVEVVPVKQTQTDGPVWLSTETASRRLGVTARTLYRFVNEGHLPAFRFGRVIRLKSSDVDAYIEGCRIQPGALDHLYAPLPESA
jgi:excisionase family DNA binding protein